MPTRRRCKQEIVWVKMDSGKLMPCAADPVEGTVVKKVVIDGKLESKGVGYLPHWDECERNLNGGPNERERRRQGNLPL